MDKSRLKNLYYVISLDACKQLESGLSATMRSCPLKLRGFLKSCYPRENGQENSFDDFCAEAFPE